MPIDDTLPDVENPVKMKSFERPSTEYLPHLSSIEVKLLEHTPLDSLLTYLPQWCTATWRDRPTDSFSLEERNKVLEDMAEGNVLPSALETINLVFLVSNIDLIDVTHLLRHRTMSFSAICTADRDLRHDDCLLKPSIECSESFLKRYLKIVSDAKQLYADMVDSDDVSILDARTILPRCLSNHYYCRVNLKDAIHFLKQRLDRQIQPESDNIVAIQMYYQLVKVYPFVASMIDLEEPDWWYINTAPTGRSSNIYIPEERNDIFPYKLQWFLYKKRREDFPGGHVFKNLWEMWCKIIEGVLE